MIDENMFSISSLKLDGEYEYWKLSNVLDLNYSYINQINEPYNEESSNWHYGYSVFQTIKMVKSNAELLTFYF